MYGVRCLGIVFFVPFSSTPGDDEIENEDVSEDRLSESLPFFPFLAAGAAFFLAATLSSSLVIDSRESVLLVLSLSDDSVMLLSSAEDVVDGEDLRPTGDSPLPFLLTLTLATTGFFLSFQAPGPFFLLLELTTGCGEGVVASDTGLEFEKLDSLSTIAEDVFDFDSFERSDDVSVVDESELDPELDIRRKE